MGVDGMAWKLTSSETITATHKAIDEFMAIAELPGERNFNQHRADLLRECYDLGRLRPVTWAVVFVADKKEWFRSNGNHTSHVLREVNGRLGGQKIYYEKYYADTLLDAADLFATFDNSLSTRSAGDVNGAFQAAIPELHGIERRIIDTGVSGLAFNEWGPWYAGRTTKEQRAEKMKPNAASLRWLSEVVAGKDRRLLMKVPVFAAILKTQERNPALAMKFWVSVKEVNSVKSKPDRKLYEFLRVVSLGARTAKKGKQAAGSVEIFNTCIHHWNSWSRRFQGCAVDSLEETKEQPECAA